MGTNYELCSPPCVTCKHIQHKIHIGKSSGGWSFSFRGYRQSWEEQHITSWKEWQSFLQSKIAEGWSIKNEYDEPVSYEEFCKLIDNKREELRNHTIYCRNDPMNSKHGWEQCWLDDEGKSFSEGEFS